MGNFVNNMVLSNVNFYRNKMDTAINAFFQQIVNQYNCNIFITANYKFYSLITENVRMDLNYLLSVNVDYDIFGFIGVRRNLRNSIEAYYDLFNLTMDNKYFYLLKYFSDYITCLDDELNIIKKDDKYSKYIGQTYLKIKDKAYISKSNGLEEGRIDNLKEISIDSNSFVHPDIFITSGSIQEKTDILKKMLDVDCLLLADSFALLVQYCGVPCQFDPYIELRTLQSFLSNCGSYIEKR